MICSKILSQRSLLRASRGATTPLSLSASRRFICSADLTIERVTDTTRFDNRPAKEDLVFGTTLSDHMLMIQYDNNQWHAPRIVPYQDLQVSPASSSLNYGVQCFEGMKAYKTLTDESLRLFRPDLNAKRLSGSMERLHMPGYDFDHNEFIECLKELVRLDSKWIPTGEGYSLYIRPNVIGTHKVLGLAPPDSLLLYIITCPVGPYYTSGFRPVRLTADTEYVRAWPGGAGNSKVGGNYAPTFLAQFQAARHGYSQVLWLFGDDDSITEVGAMNVFFLLQEDGGKQQLVTPPLTRGDILPGVTRASILELAHEWDDVEVVERSVTMPEIRQAAQDGRLLEAFGAGTAAVVTPISCIQYQGVDVEIPTPEGGMVERVWKAITGIQYGTVQGPDGWSVAV